MKCGTCRCCTHTHLIKRAAFIAIGRVVAAGLPFLTSPSIWTLVSTNQGQESPTDHNPPLHLHKKRKHMERVSLKGKWKLCMSTYVHCQHKKTLISYRVTYNKHAYIFRHAHRGYSLNLWLSVKTNLVYLVLKTLFFFIYMDCCRTLTVSLSSWSVRFPFESCFCFFLLPFLTFFAAN